MRISTLAAAGLLLGSMGAAPAAVPQAAPEAALAVQDAFRRVAASARPAVVSIDSTFKREEEVPFLFGDPQEFLRRFFGQGRDQGGEGEERARPRWQRVTGIGSGFITDPRGYILTNEHVVGGAEEIRVIVKDTVERTYKGKIVGTDPTTDLAVVKIESKEGPLPYISLGDSDRVQIGDWAIAVGSPFGLEQTVTVGVISALRQSIKVEDRDYADFFQTDAAINQGNSGGPLLDIEGRVIGVNTAIFSPSGVSGGIGFAIPSDQADRIMKELIAKGRVVRGWFGVEIVPLNDVLARQFRVPAAKGALVNSVVPGSPAAEAGLRRGDVIVEYAGKEVSSPNALIEMVEQTLPGKKVAVKLIRDGKERAETVEIGERPAKPAEAGAAEPPSEGGSRWEGARLETADESLKERYRLPRDASGAVVTEVDDGSAAQAMGLQPGDMIVAINGQKVQDAEGFLKAARGVSLRKGVVLDVNRDGLPLYLSYSQSP